MISGLDLPLVSLTFSSQHLVVISCSCDFFGVFVAEHRAHGVRQEFQEEVDWEGNQGNHHADDPLGRGETIDVNGHESSEELAAADLRDHDYGPDDDEGGVGGDALEDVLLIVDLSGADHVEDLHEHEQIEDDGQVAGGAFRLEGRVHWLLLRILLHSVQHIVGSLAPLRRQLIVILRIGFRQLISNMGVINCFSRSTTAKILASCIGLSLPRTTIPAEFIWDEARAGEEDGQNDDCLEDGLAENVLNHLSGDDVFLLSIWWPHKQLWLRCLGGECEGSKGVHDEVDPEKLDGGKWTLLEYQGADEAGEEGDYVDGQLELEESSNVVINISAPRAGLDN